MPNKFGKPLLHSNHLNKQPLLISWDFLFKTFYLAAFTKKVFSTFCKPSKTVTQEVTSTNNTIVGKTTPADISYFFVDGDGMNSNPFGFDEGEPVAFDASASKNYNLWWLSIAEQGGQQRYKSHGWTSGTVGVYDLTTFWQPSNFENLNTYKVQFAVENNKCINSSWNNLAQFFFICPAGSGCRKASDFEKKIAISPNPAQSWVHLVNFEASNDREYQLAIFDLTGRVVKKIPRWSNENIDVSNLPNGMYALMLRSGKERTFSGRLVVNH